MKFMVGNSQTREHILSLVTILVLFLILSVLLASGKPDLKDTQAPPSIYNTKNTSGFDTTDDTLASRNAS